MIRLAVILFLFAGAAKADLKDIDEALNYADVEICQDQERLLAQLDEQYQMLEGLEIEYAELESKNLLSIPLAQLHATSEKMFYGSLAMSVIYEKALRGRLTFIQKTSFEAMRAFSIRSTWLMGLTSIGTNTAYQISVSDLKGFYQEILRLQKEIKNIRQMIAHCS